MKRIISYIIFISCIFNMISPISVVNAEETTEYEHIQLPVIYDDKFKEEVTDIPIFKNTENDIIYISIADVSPLINAEWHIKDGGFYISTNNCMYFRYYNDGNMKLIIDLSVGDAKWSKSENVLLEGNLFSCEKIGEEWYVDFIKFCDMFGITFFKVSQSTIKSSKNNIKKNINDATVKELNNIDIENDLNFKDNPYYIYLCSGTSLISLYAQIMKNEDLYLWNYSCYEKLNPSGSNDNWLEKTLKKIKYSSTTIYLTIQSQNWLSNLINDSWGITKIIAAPPYKSYEHYKKSLVNISSIDYDKSLKLEDLESINKNNNAQQLERLLNSNTIISSSDSTIKILNKYLNDQIKTSELEAFTKVSDVINCIGTPVQTWFEVEEFHNKLNSINKDKIKLLKKSIIENEYINKLSKIQEVGNKGSNRLNKTMANNILLNSIDNYTGLKDSSKEICSLYKNNDKQFKDKLSKSIEAGGYALGDTAVAKILEKSGNPYLILTGAVIGVYDGFTAWTKENFGEQLQNSENLVQSYFVQNTMKISLDIKNPENLYNRLMLMLQSSLCCFEYDKNYCQSNRNSISKMLCILNNDKSVHIDYYHDPRNNNIDKNIQRAISNYPDIMVVPIEDETTPSEIVEIPEVTATEPKSELPEIVQAVLDNEKMWLNDMNEMTYGYEGHMPKVGYNECWFQDIDMDGTPEFIVGGMGFQSDGIVIQVYNIYKYKNGSLQRIEVNGRTFSGEKEPYLELLWDGEEPYYGSGAFNNLLKVFKNNNTGEFLYTMEHKYDYTSDSDGGGVISFYVYNMNKDVFECDDNHIVYCSVDKNNIINGNYRVYNHDGEVDEQEFLKTYNSFFENLTPYETTIKSIPCTKLSAEKSGYYDTMSAEQKKQALLSSYNAWSCKENPDAELPLSKFIDKLNSQNNNHFNISDYEGVFYPTSYDDCPTAITINVQSETSANVLVEITNKNYTRYGRSEFSGNINSNPFTFEENDGFNNNCKFTLEFKDGKIYLTTKHIQLDSNAGWAIPELDKIELTKGNSENPPVSDYDILSAVNKYLRENQSQLGVWLSDSNPYCLPEHISSNKTNWSCPINLSWESYSSNEIAGSYPHFAYVDKSSLKCTLTANYETVVEFDLNDYIK